jgi:hypothetical protein
MTSQSVRIILGGFPPDAAAPAARFAGRVDICRAPAPGAARSPGARLRSCQRIPTAAAAMIRGAAASPARSAGKGASVRGNHAVHGRAATEREPGTGDAASKGHQFPGPQEQSC